MKPQPSLFPQFDQPVREMPKPNPVKVEVERLSAAAERVLAYLQQHGSALNWELTKPEIGGIRAVGRIWDLQQQGWIITKEHVEKGSWRYHYKGRGQAVSQ